MQRPSEKQTRLTETLLSKNLSRVCPSFQKTSLVAIPSTLTVKKVAILKT